MLKVATVLIIPIWILTDFSPGSAQIRMAAPVQFDICNRDKRVNCVVDGDTFWFRAQKIRIADIDTPEIFSPKCDAERLLGQRATTRLLQLLNQGPFELITGEKDHDHYGRKLRVVQRAGQSIGNILIGQKLARRWTGSRESWCL